MVDHHSVLQGAAQFEPAAILARGGEFSGVANDRMLAPIRRLGVCPAIGLEIQDLDFPPGNVLTPDPEKIIFLGEPEWRTVVDRPGPFRNPAPGQNHHQGKGGKKNRRQ